MFSKQKPKDIIILIALILALIILNYPILDDKLESFLNLQKQVHVDRIIDGDTIESNGTSIRLLGINTPERGEIFYDEAKEFLEKEILNKTVSLEFGKDRYDKYNRTLAYVFLDGKNINIELVENGFANYYFYSGRDRYFGSLIDAWKSCINSNKNLCEKSVDICSECISIKSSGVVNTCSFDCNITNWKIKGEGRDKFIFNETLSQGEETGFVLDLTNSGGSLFLRDDDGKLVFWKSY